MGQFDPSPREIRLTSNYFLEAAKLHGTQIRVKLATFESRDLYKDPTYTYEDFRELNVVLDERPNRNVLESYGWYNEHDEQVPIIMYVAKFDEQGRLVKPIVGTIVRLPYELAEDEKLERQYKVANAVLTNPGSWIWVCKLAPFREYYDNETTEEVDPNYEFLNIT